MKITGIESFRLAIPSAYAGPAPHRGEQWPKMQMLLVKVTTDAGPTGWGEAFGHGGCAATKAALDTLVAPLCVGEDAGEPQSIAAKLSRFLHPYGFAGPVLFAWSGIDIALWDIAGQASGRPLYQMLAPGEGSMGAPPGPIGDVPAYASLMRYDDPGQAAEAAMHAIDRGFRQVKLHEADVKAVEATRRSLGDHVEIMLDVNCRWSGEASLAGARRLRSSRLRWIEEPCWPQDPRVMAAMAADVPVAAGENATSLAELARLARSAKLTFVQPSVAKLGGLTAMIAARGVAAGVGAAMGPHSAYFGPGLVATVHFCAANDLVCEWYDADLEANPCGAIAPSRGRMTVQQGPGLGLAIDQRIIKRYRLD